jgi:hypothetical protein
LNGQAQRKSEKRIDPDAPRLSAAGCEEGRCEKDLDIIGSREAVDVRKSEQPCWSTFTFLNA